MKLVGMSELDLNGILISEFPDSLSLEECRERLELLAYEWNERFHDGLDEEDVPEAVLSPFTVYGALYVKSERDLERMSEAERNDIREQAVKKWNDKLLRVRESINTAR